MAKLEINLNQQVRCTLTEKGLKIWNDSPYSSWPMINRISTQLHKFMNVFGPHLDYPTMDIICEKNTLEFWTEPKPDALNRRITQWNIFHDRREMWHFNTEEGAKDYIAFHADYCKKYGHKMSIKKREPLDNNIYGPHS